MAKNIHPHAKWGFYGLPYCNYDAGQNGAILKEARRISRKYKPPLPIYAYTKIEYDPKKEPDKFYNDSDLCASIVQPANMGVNGIILWSTSQNITGRCEKIQKEMQKIGQ
ncbi:hypothetical protein OESDEN_13105 [Oesophagostomum dentatum]|uniref:Hyaluronidase n=1 Tax=Oesophagostomum dentatum TaxID=61180 RepID=A0A0B1SUH2_OESDE|nr:hypothetical protein OESDEN_13105 [Oesophagostomum dentatum]